MTQSPISVEPASPWPHRLAVLVACATFPLIWVGGLVTTYDAGMAVPDWPSTYGYNLFLYPWQTWISGPWDLFIEHGHRLLGSLVGLLTIALAGVVWRCDRRRWVRWYAILCVAGVTSQGLLGGVRVLWNDRVFAKIHGCTGPLFLCLAVGMVVVTSTQWREAKPTSGRPVAPLAWLITGLVFIQIVVGAQLRHITTATTPSFFRVAVFFHIGIAVGVLAQACYLAVRVAGRKGQSYDSVLRRLTVGLLALVFVQLGLGASSWIVKYGPPLFLRGWMVGHTVAAEAFSQAMIVTGHVALGSLILVTALMVALHASRWEYLGRNDAHQSEIRATAPHLDQIVRSVEVVV